MNKLLYARLAGQNIIKNRKFYFPYLLTVAGCAAAFYILNALSGAQDLPQATRYAYLSSYVTTGTIVIGVFSVIFLFYTNSFLMKRRNRELGLYNVLGMGKRHIALVLFWETVYTALCGIASGLLFGMLFQRLVTLLIFRLMRITVSGYGFYISWKGIAVTAIFFGIVLLVNLLANLNRIRISNPIQLLHSSASGEREPKTRWILSIAGVLSLGGGYLIAMTTKDAIEAIALYFVAVFLVIIGTYCLFTAISISVLKLLRKNKNYFYKTGHFIGVSGMLYRMKRNAVGLANICLLSTMVLVMISGTLALFVGTESLVNNRCASDILLTVRYDSDVTTEDEIIDFGEKARQILLDDGRTAEPTSQTEWLKFSMGVSGDRFVMNGDDNIDSSASLVFITAAEYAELTGTPAPVLAENEIWLHAPKRTLLDTLSLDFRNPEAPDAEIVNYKIVKHLDEFPPISSYAANVSEYDYAVLADEKALEELYHAHKYARHTYGGANWEMRRAFGFDIDGTDTQQLAAADKLLEKLDGTFSVTSRVGELQDAYSVNGGFFFLGIFLGLLFIMAMVLIIYYKQITEGYEDRQRFEIMQKVGLDRKQIRRSVNGQMLTVFFMPLLAAAVHIAFDFRLMVQLLSLFGLTNIGLTLLCTAVTLVGFLLIYGCVYLLTAKTYYRIVAEHAN